MMPISYYSGYSLILQQCQSRTVPFNLGANVLQARVLEDGSTAPAVDGCARRFPQPRASRGTEADRDAQRATGALRRIWPDAVGEQHKNLPQK
jgi:hypothetical protein